MVSTALSATALAPPDAYLADAVQVYKPARAIYAGLLRHVHAVDVPERVWLVSGCAPCLLSCDSG